MLLFFDKIPEPITFNWITFLLPRDIEFIPLTYVQRKYKVG